MGAKTVAVVGVGDTVASSPPPPLLLLLLLLSNSGTEDAEAKPCGGGKNVSTVTGARWRIAFDCVDDDDETVAARDGLGGNCDKSGADVVNGKPPATPPLCCVSDR